MLVPFIYSSLVDGIDLVAVLPVLLPEMNTRSARRPCLECSLILTKITGTDLRCADSVSARAGVWPTICTE